jgi:protoporphyrinogen oxidase
VIAHAESIAARVARWPGLHVAGGGLFGVGIPECIRQGQEAAAAMLSA